MTMLLQVRNLRVSFRVGKHATVEALKGVSFDVPAHATVALVGESGSGKSVSSLAVMGLLPRESTLIAPDASIAFEGRELLAMPAHARRRLCGRDIAMIFQEPMSSLNPVFTVGFQIGEVLRQHMGMNARQARARTLALLDEVEKVFSTSSSDQSGTTSTMLSQLLWWLAERRSKVFVVMTTNNAKALPKELYREGRIDETMWFGGLDENDARAFIVSVLKTFGITHFTSSGMEVGAILLNTIALPTTTNPLMYSQAALTTSVYDHVKAMTLKAADMKKTA